MADEKEKNEDAFFSDLSGDPNADPFASNDSADPLAPSGADSVFGQSDADPFASNDSADPLAPSGADNVFGQSDADPFASNDSADPLAPSGADGVFNSNVSDFPETPEVAPLPSAGKKGRKTKGAKAAKAKKEKAAKVKEPKGPKPPYTSSPVPFFVLAALLILLTIAADVALLLAGSVDFAFVIETTILGLLSLVVPALFLKQLRQRPVCLFDFMIGLVAILLIFSSILTLSYFAKTYQGDVKAAQNAVVAVETLNA